MTLGVAVGSVPAICRGLVCLMLLALSVRSIGGLGSWAGSAECVVATSGMLAAVGAWVCVALAGMDLPHIDTEKN